MSTGIKIIVATIFAIAAVTIGPALQSSADDIASSEWAFADPIATVLAYMPIILGAMVLVMITSLITEGQS